MSVVDQAEAQYREREGTFGRLKDEAIFSLKTALTTRNLQVHDVLGRVKKLESFLDKIRRKGYERPFEQSPDLVGLRVISLFLSDLPRVREAVDDVFEILEEENKVEGEDVASFGYMSIHYVCKIGNKASGPRYDAIRNLHFELQSRTIVMDAWANVSHHLAYKGEASIPGALRRDFHALSGLFYVADQHFQLFAKQATNAEVAAATEVADGDLDHVPVNADTLLAFIRRRYLDRGGSDKEGVSELAEQLLRAGYTSLGALEGALVRGEPLASEEEGSTRYLVDVGVVRRAVCAIDAKFAAIVEEDVRKELAPGILDDQPMQ